MKICPKCNLQAEFSNHKGKKDGLYPICKSCKRQYDKNWYSSSSSEYKARKSERVHQYFVKTRKWLYDYLCIHPCVCCGEADPVVLEFDHLGKKNFTIGMNRGVSFQKIKDEVALCQVLCANCHRRKTAKQFNWYINYLDVGESGTPPDLESGSTGSSPVV